MNTTLVAQWLIETAWQSAALVVLVWVTQMLLGRWLSPAWRCGLWAVVAIRLVMPVLPASGVSVYGLLGRHGSAVEQAEPVAEAAAPQIGVDAAVPEVIPASEVPAIQGPARATVPDWPTWQSLVVIVWLCVAGLLLVRQLVQAMALRRLRRYAVPCDISCAVAVLESDRVHTPALAGLFRPYILLPQGTVARLSPERLGLVLEHELTHLRRGDHWGHAAASVLQAMHWSNPFVYFAVSRYRLERELACDRAVLDAQRDHSRRATYGKTLLDLATWTPPGRQFAPVAMAEGSRHLKARIAEIAADRPGRGSVVVGIVTALLLVGCGLTQAQTAKTPTSAAQPTTVPVSADTAFAPTALAKADSKSQELAAAGKWSEAIEAYARSLSQMTPMQYRDKKDFEWVLTEYDRKAAGTLDSLKQVANDLLAKHPGQDMYEWRLHRLLADIALKQGDKDAEQKELDLAIKTYPADISGDPSRFSSLQHLYNRRALLTADKDIKASEDYILKAFKNDPRFVYFFGFTWKGWYEQNNQPQRYEQLMKRVQSTYTEKAAADAKNRGLLQQYAKQLAQEIATATPSAAQAANAASTQATHPFSPQDIRFLGDVLKVDDKSITISLNYQQGIRRPAATTKTFVLDKERTRALMISSVRAQLMANPGVPVIARLTPMELSDLKVGQSLAIAAEGDLATHIEVLPAGEPFPMRNGNPREPGGPGPTTIARGNITKLDGDSLTVDSRQPAGLITVLADDNSQVLLDGERAYLDDLKERMSVRVTSFPATARFPARLEISASSPLLRGTVVRLDGRNVIVLVTKPDGASSEVTVPTNDQTEITDVGVVGGRLTPSRSIHLEDLVEGMRLSILPETGMAKRIAVLPQGRSATQPVATQPTAAEERRPGGLRVLGPSQTVLKVEERSITLRLVPTMKEGAKEVTVAISQERTKVRLPEAIEEVKREDGTVGRRVTYTTANAGTLADLKVGQKVIVMVDDEGAREISILPAFVGTRSARAQTQPSTRPTQAVAAQTRPTGRPWLGIVLITVGDHRELATNLGYTDDAGFVVNQVYPDSPADGVLRLSDIVTKVDGEKLEGMGILQDHVDSAGVGGKVTLTVFREKKMQEVEVTVGAKPPSVTLSRPTGK